MAPREAGAHAEERRQALVQAAYHSIAEHGLEGLRTREVAAQVGMTHATLHYYFPTKTDLIKAVVQYAIHKRILARVPPPSRDGSQDPKEQLHTYLTALQRQIQEEPTSMLVLYELSRYAQHEPGIQEVMHKNFRGWHDYLVYLLNACIKQGTVRADIDPEAVASLLTNHALGLGISFLVPLPVSADRMLQQLERWLAP